MNRGKIISSRFGNIFSLDGNWRDEFESLFIDSRCVGFEIWPGPSKENPSLNFLERFPAIRFLSLNLLQIDDFSIVDRLHGLMYLKFLANSSEPVRLDRLPELQSFTATWHENIQSLFDAKGLLSLSVFKLGNGTAKKLSSLTCLRALDMRDSNVDTVSFLNSLESLQKLRLGLLPKLSEIKSISHCKHLSLLRFERCRKVSDFSVLATLSSLKYLFLLNDNSVPNISFSEKLPLILFNFDVKVQDGDLSYIADKSTLKVCVFPRYKHYRPPDFRMFGVAADGIYDLEHQEEKYVDDFHLVNVREG